STLALLLSLGVVHNIGAWSRASQLQIDFISEIKQLEPNPPLNAQFVFHGMPKFSRGVFFMRDNLPETIRMALGRDDLSASHDVEPASAGTAATGPVIHIQWKGEEGALLARMPQ